MKMLLSLVVSLLLNQANVHCHFSAYRSHKKISMNLMGYESTEKGIYPHIYGEKLRTILLACEVNFLKENNKDIYWLRNKKQIDPPPYPLPWKNGSVLMIRPLLTGLTDGVYECVATNRYNTVKKGVNISVVDRERLMEERFKDFPRIRTHPTHVRTLRNQVDFHCVVSGKSPLKIVWFHNRVPLPANPAFNVSPTTNIGNVYSSNLMIANVTKETKGFYQCAAMNSIGHAVSKQGNIQFRGNSKRLRRSLKGLWRQTLTQRACTEKVENRFAQNITSMNVKVDCKIEYPNYLQKVDWISFNDEHRFRVRFESLDPDGNIKCNSSCLCGTLPKGINSKKFYFDRNLIYEVTVFELGQNDTVISKGIVRTKKCPSAIKAPDMPNVMTPIETGTDFTFKPVISGQPEPRVYNWKFSPDLHYCDFRNQVVTNSTPHIQISKDRLSLTVVKATKEQQGCYQLYLGNEHSEETIKGYLRVKDTVPDKKDVFGPTLGGVTGGLFLIVIVILIYKRYMNPKHLPQPPPPTNPAQSVYISHNVKGKRNEMKLLKFANFLQQDYAIQVNLDLTSQVEINRYGGMCQWVPRAMERSDKVIVVLTRSYLKAVKQHKQADDHVCKVHAEFTTVKKIIYHDLQKTHRILIVIDDEVKASAFPDPLKGRSYFLFPDCNAADDIDLKKIAFVLLDEEMIQLPSQTSTT